MADITNEHESLAEALRGRLERVDKRMMDLWDAIDRSADASIDRLRPFLDELERAGDSVRGVLSTVRTSSGDHGRELARAAKAELQGLEDEVAAAAHELQEQLAGSRAGFRDAAKEELDAWRSRLDGLGAQKDFRKVAHEEIDDLRDRAEQAFSAAKGHIEEIADEGEETLEIVRAGAGRALDELRSTVRELRDRGKSAA